MIYKEELIKFVEWTKLKIRLHLKPDNNIYFFEREICWVSLGVNIGFEQDGKNDNFERPVLILKKFGPYTLWALPLTTKIKRDCWYHYIFNYQGDDYAAILTQLRLISSKRLLRKVRTLPEEDFDKIKQIIKDFL